MESPTQCPFCDTGLTTVDHVLWDCKETEKTKSEMRMTLWKRGEEEMRKIVEYTRKVDSMTESEEKKKTHLS
jgi:hypothetical protein